MLPPPPTRSLQPLALFLDFDGTLVELADAPDQVQVPDELRGTLASLNERLAGALAVVSGRRLDNLLQHLAPLELPAAGNHGLEYQLRPGQRQRLSDAAFPPAALEAIADLAAKHEGLLLEQKGQSMALHYRLAPELEELVAGRVTEIRDRHAPGFMLQPGKLVWEMRPGGASKGTAIETFMQHAPFAGRLPVFIGDDLTDEFGFQAVDELGGWSIHVGPAGGRTAACMQLPDVAAVGKWLQDLGSELSARCA